MRNRSGTLTILRLLVGLACLINGLLAGENTYRYLIEVPAWKHLDINDWAKYSRHADLGNGIWLFSTEAILGFILMIAASIILFRAGDKLRQVTKTIYTGTLLAALGIVFTLFAAPLMLSLENGMHTTADVQAIFDQFHYWGSFRAVAQVFLFVSNIWALKKIYSITGNEAK